MPAKQRLAYRMYQRLWSGLDWLYPPSCGGCGKRGIRWCDDCLQMTRLILPPYCPRCGQSKPNTNLCINCRTEIPKFEALRSWAAFEGPLRKAMHRLKYQKDIAVGELFSRFLLSYLQQIDWKVDLVVPVPLGVARLRERGYNQSALLARPLALGMGYPYLPQALVRVRETASQINLNVTERKQNVAGAFRAKRQIVQNRCVLVVDDVTTSGATIDACASALIQAGADQVYGLTLARANFKATRSTELP